MACAAASPEESVSPYAAVFKRCPWLWNTLFLYSACSRDRRNLTCSLFICPYVSPQDRHGARGVLVRAVTDQRPGETFPRGWLTGISRRTTPLSGVYFLLVCPSAYASSSSTNPLTEVRYSGSDVRRGSFPPPKRSDLVEYHPQSEAVATADVSVSRLGGLWLASFSIASGPCHPPAFRGSTRFVQFRPSPPSHGQCLFSVYKNERARL